MKGQVIWITGASTGIGAALAIEAAKHGARLVISARSEDKLRTVKQRCLGKIHLYKLSGHLDDFNITIPTFNQYLIIFRYWQISRFDGERCSRASNGYNQI